MKNWSKALSKVIPSLVLALFFYALASVCFALDPSPVPPEMIIVDNTPTSIGEWIHMQGGFVAAIVALMLGTLAILKGFHDFCIQMHLKEPGWLGVLAGFIAKCLSYLTANTVQPPQTDKSKKG